MRLSINSSSILTTLFTPLLSVWLKWYGRSNTPKVEGTLRLEELQFPVEVLRDRWGVPHIFAENIHDMLLTQGYVHAQDRLWQMDFQRRLAAGRLAEVLGAEALPVDRWMRTLGLRRVAEREPAQLYKRNLGYLEAYAEGVNLFMRTERLPAEFTLLGYKPEPWTLADSLSWAKVVAWCLSVNWESELLRTALIERLGESMAAGLEPPRLERWPVILPKERTPENILPPSDDTLPLEMLGDPPDLDALRKAEEARRFTGPPTSSGLGSNGWVVSGKFSTTGKPILANDMHLSLGAPSIWYENHIVGGDIHAAGVTFPGVPGVVAGHNGNVAWGITNGFADVQDLYLERLRTGSSGSLQYEFKGEWREAEVRREVIRVKGQESVEVAVVGTCHGPVLSDLPADLGGGKTPVALRWTSFEPDGMLNGLFGMLRATNCKMFQEMLRDWAGPVVNVVCADTQGNIGYSYAGRIPVRAKGDGRLPVPGWSGEYEWSGNVPFEELPRLFNPPQGYIVTANNDLGVADFPYPIGNEFCAGDRAQRIVELLESRGSLNLAVTKEMQLDQVSTSARAVAQVLGQLAVDGPDLQAVVELMKAWDAHLSANSPAAALYEVFIRQLIQKLLSTRLGELTLRAAGKEAAPLPEVGSMFGDKLMTWLLVILEDAQSPWYDLGGGEDRDTVFRQVLGESVELLRARCGPRIEDWSWGKLHTLTFAHLLGSVPGLEQVYNRGPFPVGGDASTIWALSKPLYSLDGAETVGPPYRFIADLGDLSRSQSVLVPGQSGRAGSRHYDDQIQAWFSGDTHTLLFTREQVDSALESRLILIPRETEEMKTG